MVVEVFGSGAVVADVVRTPPGAEAVTTSAQLPDQFVKVLVVRVAAGFRTHDGNGDVGEGVPVRVEAAGGGVEEGEAGQVLLVAGRGVDVGVEGAEELVRREDVHAAVTDERRSGGDGVQSPLQAAVRLPPLLGTPTSRAGEGVRAVGGLGQIHQVGALGVIELEGAGESFEYCRETPARLPRSSFE